MCSRYPVSFATLHGAGIFMFIGFVLMIFFLWLARPLARWQGGILLALYVVYLAYELGWFSLIL
jgi:Ca2+/Na+ antiporter